MAAVPHLDEGVVSEILHRLPTKEAYHSAAVCRRWRAVLSEPTFLCRHLAVRPLLPDERPFAFIVQPKGKVRYTHVTLVPTDPGDSVRLNLPLARTYMDPPPPPPPPPALLDDTAAGISVLRLLYRPEDRVSQPELLDTACGEDDDSDLFGCLAFPSAGADDFVPVPEEETVVADDKSRVVPPGSDDYVFFFERTVPTLNISLVASHGRLLLGRSRVGFYVCNPAANRWLALPPSTTVPGLETNSGLHYDILDDGASGTAFTVVLLARRRRRRVLVETFSSTTGRWDALELAAPGAARRLGAASPGIHVGTCFYWLCRDRRLEEACQVNGGSGILRYNAARGRVSVLREPPEPEQSKARVGRSLGSVGGRLRMCAFDIVRDDHESQLPHEGLEGAHGVWMMTTPEEEHGRQWRWRRVHEAVVGGISTWYFNMLFDHEKPVDFAGACGDFIVVEKEMFLLRYDLESGTKVHLFSLYRSSGKLGNLYDRFHAFAFFR